MKKIIASLSLAALTVMTFGPALSVAETVGTSLEREITVGDKPIVMVSWVANYDLNAGRHVDHLPLPNEPGSQIYPTGVFEGHRTISMCAIVTSPYGLSYVGDVYADVFYPEYIELGDHHIPLPNQTGDGCGMWMQQDKLTRLSKTVGIALFCDRVKNQNNNLPYFVTPYGYDNICGVDGYLEKDTAAVWCGEKQISYEDPSGDYKVNTVVYDQGGMTEIHTHGFTYMPITAFEIDFASIDYGKLKQGFEKIIQGNTIFDMDEDPSRATVRNVGNTRLQMGLVQDDMDLKHTGGVWNVKYRAKIGSSTPWPSWKEPFEHYWLDKDLDLSEKNQMDFGIEVIKFPTHDGVDQYIGSMTLDARYVCHLSCSNNID